jgi:hypothetical protein
MKMLSLQLTLMKEDSKKHLWQKGVTEMKIVAKWERRNNGLSLVIPSIFLCLIITYIQCEISLKWEE